MGKKVILAILAASMATAAGAVETNDTIADVKKPERVVILENDSVVNVKIKGKEDNEAFTLDYIKAVAPGTESISKEHSSNWDFSLPLGIKKKGKSHSEFSMGGIGFGFVSAVDAPKEMDVDMFSSFEIFADLMTLSRYTSNNKHEIGLGFGIDWKNYRMTGRTRFGSDESGNLIFTDYKQGVDPKFSRIKVFSLTVPLKYRYHFTRKFSAGLSAIVNFNTYASTKTRYMEDGKNAKEMNKNIHQRPVTMDLQATVRWHSISIYAKYSPCSVLRSDFGPNFKGFSVGLILF